MGVLCAVAHVQHGPKRSVDRNPHQEPDHGEYKSQKICFCITGWILLFENSNPLTYQKHGRGKYKI